VLEGKPAAGGRQRTDRGQQAGGLLGGQVDEQPLGQPRSGLGGLQARPGQLGRPVPAKVDRQHGALAPRHGPLGGQHPLLEGQHLRQVKLEQAHAFRPGQPERAGIQPGGEQHTWRQPAAQAASR
jgi:hypothetical protein